MAGEAVALTDEPAQPSRDVAWRPLCGDPLTLSMSTAWRADAASTSIEAFTGVAVDALRREADWRPAPAPAASAAYPPRPSSGPLS
jgi:hypothetical protein